VDTLRRNRKPGIKTTKATVKRNLNDKLSKVEILAFSYARKLHRSTCYRSRLLINKFNARESGYVLERKFTKFSEISQCNGHYAVHGHSRSPILVPIEAHIRLPISD